MNEHIERLVAYLAKNPGASFLSVLDATYGRTVVHESEVLSIFYSARAYGYGAARDGLWYLIADNEELKTENFKRSSPGPLVNDAIQALWTLRNTLGVKLLDFTPITAHPPIEGETTP